MGDRVAGRIRFYRRARELTVQGLARECERLGMPELTEASLWNIERRATSPRKHRRVSVEELLLLARALRVPPLVLVSAPLAARCGKCSNQPPPGFTCNTCNRATVTPEKGQS